MNSKIYSILIIILYTQVSNATDCNVTAPDNSQIILDSRIYHTLNPMRSAAIPGWTLLDVDMMTYPILGTQIGLEWEVQTSTGDCSPHYSSCPAALITVDPDIERNWIVTSYYVTEADNIEIRIECISVTIITDCRTSIKAYYFESDQNLTDVTSQLDQFKPTQLINRTTGDNFFYFSFSKTERGFYIGFLNNEPCVNIESILFYYFECPAVTADFYSVSTTLAPNSTHQPTIIPLPSVPCPIRTQIVTPVTADCYANGTWVLPPNNIDLCECVSGAEAISSSCTNCSINTYKTEPGNTTVCTDCPENSSTNGVTGATTATECVCDVDWFRGVGESVLQSCGRSPSAVRNLRITRGDVLAAEWDIPSDLGNRNETSYGVDLLETLSGMTTSVFIISMTEYNLDTVSSYTEYTITVTSRNAISSVSNEFYERSLTFLSSFPDVTTPIYIDNYLSWSYTLYAVSDYQFKLTYTSTQTGSNVTVTVSSSSCDQNANIYECRVLIPNLNASSGVLLSLLAPSGPNVNLSSGTITVGTTPTTATPGPFSTMMLIYYVVIPIAGCLIATILLLICLSCCVLCCLRRRKKVFKLKPKDSEMIPLSCAQQYQDPSLYEDLNKAVRALAKEIDANDIEKDSLIGVGEFGDVWKGYFSRNNQKLPVALKILKPASTEKNKDDFFKEASVMGQFSHPNVIFLYGVTLRKPIMIVTPFMENGSLDKYLTTNMNSIPFKELVAICYGASRGMVYLSLLGYVHRDLAARNIILDKDLTPKITDFGLSRETEEDFYRVQTGGKIPVRWTAPEAILYRKFNTASDVWSFGVLMWEVMSFGNIPYGDTDNFTIMEELQKGYRLPAPDSCPSVIYNLMLRCWSEAPEHRPSFTNVQESLLHIIETNKTRPASVRVNAQNPLHHTTLESWLTSLKLEKYALNFREHGYTQIAAIWHLTDADLFNIGVIPAGHRNKIMTSIHRANSQLCNTYSIPL
eukprot:TRINITY_DN453_c0_g1_i2.p1 TRINITY_DN453_c0_g1~~TRINITY_DN453_c0_g1_i2.p1  ORF type:complete len:976 (+),score=243.96 TRINITY_DN453_c0_g1_i2:347-3274(+)